MLSAVDIQFEPPQTKIYQFLPSVIGLVAGDPYAQMAICESTAAHIRYSRTPFTTVEQVALVYAEKFSKYRRERAETKILKPQGLDANSLMDRQQDFRREVVADLMHRMEESRIEVEAIIAGLDPDGTAHILVVNDPGYIDCADAVAFASIGAGKQHADSQFMMARHTRNVPWQGALFSTYVAKKRAEVAPTVGMTHTDLFFVGLNGYQAISDSIHDVIRSSWETLEFSIAADTEAANNRVDNFLDQYLRQHDERQRTAEPAPQPDAERHPASQPEVIPPPPVAAEETKPRSVRQPRKRAPKSRKNDEPS